MPPHRRHLLRDRSSLILQRRLCFWLAQKFGDEVHFHLVTTAKQEWARFNQVVTDWELQRNFERI